MHPCVSDLFAIAIIVFLKHTRALQSTSQPFLSQERTDLLPTSLHNLSAPFTAGNLPWPTNNTLARETEISSLSEILLRSQCGRDEPNTALARRHTTLDTLDE